jgi:hypothetical protein
VRDLLVAEPPSPTGGGFFRRCAMRFALTPDEKNRLETVLTADTVKTRKARAKILLMYAEKRYTTEDIES